MLNVCIIMRNIKSVYSLQRALLLSPHRSFSYSVLRRKSARTELCHQLEAKIKMGGPLTVSQYMKEALTNPVAGYYTQREVFGQKGDFTTSPEISQMFGEILGIWCVSEWMAHGSPSNLQVVELGPGRGTLADDMLRVFSQFEGMKDAIKLNLVEVSQNLSNVQKEKLCSLPDVTISQSDSLACSNCYNSGISKYGPPVYWYNHLQQVPKGLTFYIAHEFFDALPIHKFQKKDGKWHEILVDIDADGPHHFRYVLSPKETPASKILLQLDPNDPREHMELCPEGGVIVQEIAGRIAESGGFALIADYGHYGEKSDTFRGFKDHQLHEVLEEPGMADLTADVDFSYLKRLVEKKVVTFGPITQECFLTNMGMAVRMQVLMSKATDSAQRRNLITAYDMLTNPKKMGERFKFFSMLQKQQHLASDYIPAGFKSLES